MSYSEEHLREAAEIVSKLDAALCEKAVELLATVRARAAGFLFSGLEVARRTLRTRSTIFERSQAWNATHRPIMSQS